MDKPLWTDREWRVEAVSDAVRVVSGVGRSKVIIGRFAPRQLPEAETSANARLASAAREMYQALDTALRLLEAIERSSPSVLFEKPMELARYALAKAKGDL